MDLYRNQLSALTKKNFLLIARNRKNLLLIILTPILITLCIFYFLHLLGQAKAATKTPNPVLQESNKIPRCLGPKDCISIGYFIVGEHKPWIDEAMRAVAQSNKLQFGSDVKLLQQGSPHDILEYTASHKNQTQIAVVFCTSNWPITFGSNSIEIPCQFEKLDDKQLVFYSIYYNMTLGFQTPYFFKLNAPFPTNKLVVNVKRAVDEALVNIFTHKPFTLDLKTQSFPTTENKFFKDYDFLSNSGSFFFYLPTAVS